jgi:hypothetical protein
VTRTWISVTPEALHEFEVALLAAARSARALFDDGSLLGAAAAEPAPAADEPAPAPSSPPPPPPPPPTPPSLPAPPPAAPARRCERMQLDWTAGAVEGRGATASASWAGLLARVESKSGPLSTRYTAIVTDTAGESVLHSTAMGLEPRSEAAARKLCEVFMWHAATYGADDAQVPAPPAGEPEPAAPPPVDEREAEKRRRSDAVDWLAHLDHACPKVGDSVFLGDLFHSPSRPFMAARHGAEQTGRYRLSRARRPGQLHGQPAVVLTRIAQTSKAGNGARRS